MGGGRRGVERERESKRKQSSKSRVTSERNGPAELFFSEWVLGPEGGEIKTKAEEGGRRRRWWRKRERERMFTRGGGCTQYFP